MIKLKLLYLKIMERICPLIGKDSMRFKLEKYRCLGAKIGENVRAFSNITSGEPYLLTVGDNVTVAIGVSFITHDNSIIKIYDDATDLVGPISIGNNVFIGANSTILPGVNIADNCIVGACSVVNKSCNEPGSIIAGNPAKTIGKIDTMKDKYVNYKFKFGGGIDKRTEIMNHPEKWLKK